MGEDSQGKVGGGKWDGERSSGEEKFLKIFLEGEKIFLKIFFKIFFHCLN